MKELSNVFISYNVYYKLLVPVHKRVLAMKEAIQLIEKQSRHSSTLTRWSSLSPSRLLSAGQRKVLVFWAADWKCKCDPEKYGWEERANGREICRVVDVPGDIHSSVLQGCAVEGVPIWAVIEVILNSTDVPSVLIGTGSMIVSFGLFGCFAACRGRPWMLKLYALFLSLVFLAELVASISGLFFQREIKDSFLKIYSNAVQNYNGNNEKSQAVDQVQYSLICCGVKDYTDWKTSPYFLDHGIPHSCCKSKGDCNPQDLQNLTVAATKVNQRGCYNLMMGFLEGNMGVIIGVLFAATFSQLIGMKLSCCLSQFIMTHQYEMM
ncbi:hypothetical protein STEG23_011713 [Scotinomys teguina]